MNSLRRSIRMVIDVARAVLWKGAKIALRALVSREGSRRLVNRAYRKLSLESMTTFHARFAGLFRGRTDAVAPGTWHLAFLGRSVGLPLTSDRMWLDWDCATAILGHEAEIKATYANLIRSDVRPEVFVDVGSNYGTHSLLFLVHGIDAISFEPNEACHAYMREACALNGVEPTIISAALTDSTGSIDLWFPERETWMGTTDPDVRERLESGRALSRRVVRTALLDDSLDDVADRRLLIKIDTEGGELSVLKGAISTLERHRPPVIFESFDATGRDELFTLFASVGYRVTDLPWTPDRSDAYLDLCAFTSSGHNNFIAVPAA